MTANVNIRVNVGKKQRGKVASPVIMMESKAQFDHFNLVLESSDDEAPEEVTFEDSRAQALRSMKQALETAKREKELLKEKRRKRQELFQEQKKRKLLPVDVLEEIDSAASKKQKESEDEDFSHGDEGEEDEKTMKKGKKSGKLANSRNLTGNYTVTTVTKEPVASMQQRAAEDFIQSRLYGAGSCRSTNNELLSLQNKTGRNKGAAVQFVKKDWASNKKAKAEKLKKRWIHKQQVSSSC